MEVEAAPAPRKKPSLFERALWKVSIKSFQLLISFYVFFGTKVKKRSSDERPTYVKRYPARPTLDHHVWIPSWYKAGESPLLPLLIDIHGGGFCIGHPFIDDKDCAIYCRKHGMCVVSINYRKAPDYGFPIPVEDVAAVIQAVLEDPDLPVDKSKVALMGYSAGGNLSLAAPQLNGLHDKLKAVVAFYPVTDFTRTLEQRVAKSTPPPGRKDMLTGSSKAFNWVYLRGKEDFKNPILSPLYADRSKLPKKLFLLGCEYDILCGDARDAAENYAQAEPAESKKLPLEGGRSGWTCGDVTYEELKGLEHGYNQRWELQKGELKELWKRRTQEIHDEVAKWLVKEVYA
jgi:acetyl esterase/lipase